MGIKINLDVMFYKVSDSQWAELYDKTIEILKKYPNECMSMKNENSVLGKRTVFTREFEKDIENDKKRHWQVCGDFKTKERGESFVLFRNRSKYTKTKEIEEIDTDIITEEALQYISEGEEFGSYRTVYSEKTQGRSYHNIILAVSLYIENKLYPYAMVSGDLTEDNAIEVTKWLKEVTGEDIKIPVCFNIEELSKKLNSKYDEMQAMRSLRNIYQGSEELFYQFIDKTYEKSIVRNFLFKILERYTSATQIGVIDVIKGWLGGTGKIEELCNMLCLDKNGPKYTPQDFAKGLKGSWLNVKTEDKEALSLHQTEGAPVTIDDRFTNMFMDMYGLKGRKTKFYIQDEELFEILKKIFPKDATEMQTIILGQKKQVSSENIEIDDETSELYKKLQNLIEEVEKVNLITEIDSQKITTVKEAMTECIKKEDLSSLLIKKFEAYAKAYNKFKKELLKKDNDISTKVQKDYLEDIFDYTNQINAVFTEDAWIWIEQEKDINLLEIIFLLSKTSNMDKDLWEFRNAIFENRNLCVVFSEIFHQ